MTANVQSSSEKRSNLAYESTLLGNAPPNQGGAPMLCGHRVVIGCARKVKYLFFQEAKPRTMPPCPACPDIGNRVFLSRTVCIIPHPPAGIPMPSFDIVSEVNRVELKNAVDQANKEIANRFDFKGSDARVEQAELVLTIYADDDFKLKQVTDVLLTKCAKRGVDARMFDTKSVERIGTKVKQPIHVKAGIEQEKAKSIVKLLKDSKMKVQASIQGTAVRVSGGKKDDLQAAIALVRKSVTDIPLQFQNFRD